MSNPILIIILLITAAVAADRPTVSNQPPNVVIIYADDMGYGDLAIQNAKSKIPTPNLDRLAGEGMRFTDAHSSSGICSPSRYALLTGKYHWRRQHGIVNSFGPPFFNDSDVTLPEVLRQGGYTTACIGKWHLGWNWTFNGPPSGSVGQWGEERAFYLPEDVDFSGPIPGGPLARGFDYYFGDGTINFPPYAWMENDRMLVAPTAVMLPDEVGFETAQGNWEFRPGPKVEGWNPYDVLPTLTDRAVAYIGDQQADKPFFLYFALPSPHAPIIPNEEFVGKTAAGGYGDFVYETDHMIGRVLDALEMAGFADNTLVIFSSDNGPEIYAFERAERYGHFSMGELRGIKRDIYEGGHRVPLIVRWPGQIPAGTVRNQTIAQMDLMPTIATAAGIELPAGAAPDGYDQTPIIRGAEDYPAIRKVTVHNTYAERWALRKGDWLLIDDATGEQRPLSPGFAALRKYEPLGEPQLLFDLAADPGQRHDLSRQHPEKVAELRDHLMKMRQRPHSH